MNAHDRVRIQHILDAADESIAFVRGETRVSLDNDPKLVKALMMNIAIIGEAASRVTKETQTAYPEIPWSAITGMRNVLIHAYFDVDLDEVWSTVKNDLPPLIDQLRQVIPPPTNSVSPFD